jgi:hypothetical protein
MHLMYGHPSKFAFPGRKTIRRPNATTPQDLVSPQNRDIFTSRRPHHHRARINERTHP